jgi:acetyl esterase/lipase
MSTVTRRMGLGLALAGLSAACSPLALFATAVPKDPLDGRASYDIAYGEAPRQRLDVYPGAGDSAAKPVIVFIYGGGWDSGRKQDYRWVGRALAAQGFLTVVPDYRLVPEVLYPDFLSDCAAAVRWTHDNAARFGGNPDRLVLMGHSAGAYNAVMLALDKRFVEGAGVPAGAIRGAVGLAGPYDFYPWDAEASRNAFGQWKEPLETQPVTYAHADAPPLLLLHGDADTTVRPRNTERLAARMNAAGGRAAAKIYPAMDHKGAILALSRPFRGKSTLLDDATAFARDVTR